MITKTDQFTADNETEYRKALAHEKDRVPYQIMGSGEVPVLIDGRLVTEFHPKDRPLPAKSRTSCVCTNFNRRTEADRANGSCFVCPYPFA